MADTAEVSTSSATELLSTGRRNLAVRDFSAAAEALAKACELLAKEHGDTADQCAEAYLWYGKSLLGLSREESGVLGDGMPGTGNADENDDDNEEENGDDEQNGEDAEMNEAASEEAEKKEVADEEMEKNEPESTTKDDEPGSSKPGSNKAAADSGDNEEPGTTNGDVNDESEVNLDEDDVDNLQLAWEMLDLARSILQRRAQADSGTAARALLADVHLALGEVALESETYDKAVIDMQSCLELQKELYGSDDRRIAETHYQIGLANSLASNFEDAITHFKNAANILETRIKTLENPASATDDATVKKYTTADPQYSVEGEIKELKELLPEIQEKIQDMMDYKAETIKRVRETLCPSNGDGASSSAGSSSSTIASASASTARAAPASDISHLIKRKRKSSEGDAGASAPKKLNT
ncbi:protein HGV2-like isoform X1 [Ostrinia furnacalis]|uniref:protein HGV2-like isoform X1 n=1 Tax=Ostrinia furnacalis TaxID=93504 RepID=UPI001040CFE1|nr:protein HGV2-like isoform X1 [Ostrinia furnacalis]XP_028169768.1 protein HGV2-like isoform X1 [Ostrinia furnacalis]